MKKGRVLYIEDSSDDVEIFQHIVSQLSYNIQVSHAPNGKAGITALGIDQEAQEDQCAYDLVFLDLNLPDMMGIDILKQLRENNPDKDLPVLIFTSSPNPQDVARCYAAGANSYFVKPVDYHFLSDMLEGIFKYWFEYSTLPKKLTHESLLQELPS